MGPEILQSRFVVDCRSQGLVLIDSAISEIQLRGWGSAGFTATWFWLRSEWGRRRLLSAKWISREPCLVLPSTKALIVGLQWADQRIPISTAKRAQSGSFRPMRHLRHDRRPYVLDDSHELVLLFVVGETHSFIISDFRMLCWDGLRATWFNYRVALCAHQHFLWDVHDH